MWYFGSAEGSKFVEYTSAENLKRTWVNYGEQREWQDTMQGQGEEFLYQATQVKNIWIPMGDIFANWYCEKSSNFGKAEQRQAQSLWDIV